VKQICRGGFLRVSTCALHVALFGRIMEARGFVLKVEMHLLCVRWQVILFPSLKQFKQVPSSVYEFTKFVFRALIYLYLCLSPFLGFCLSSLHSFCNMHWGKECPTLRNHAVSRYVCGGRTRICSIRLWLWIGDYE